LCIGLNQANGIQVYRSGSALDDQLRNNTTTTTVNSDSNSGQKVVNVASVAPFVINDRVILNEGGAREETGYINSIGASSITLQANLTYTHTAGQADVVKVKNRWTDLDSTNNTITGNWGTGAYMLASWQSRLAFAKDSSNVIEYTPMSHETSSGVWDLASSTGAGFYQTSGKIMALIPFIPTLENSLEEYLYIGTSTGLEILTGFLTYDRLIKIEGSKAPLNHRAYVKTKNWIIYLTLDRNIMACNGTRVIDLGRRVKKTTADGVLDTLAIASSKTNAFGFYNKTKEQAFLYFNTSGDNLNDTAIVIDFKLGEPTLNEGQEIKITSCFACVRSGVPKRLSP